MIYSIGYGNRSLNEFINALKRYHVEYVIDVRSKPFSMNNRDFNGDMLECHLMNSGMKYVFFGHELGGRPNDDSCYTDGKVDYSLLEKRGYYKRGIERLKSAFEQGYHVALMCSELRPEDCHRSKLIGMTLLDEGIHVQHITEKNEICLQDNVVTKISDGKLLRNLFGELDLKSRKRYK